jgi:cytochrome c oxidase assembly protein subunit 15
MGNAWLHRYSVLVAICALLLVVAGALVTSQEAALSVPDWPLSYGRLVPPLEGNIVYEFAHRASAAAVGLLTLVLAVWITCKDPRAWMKRLGWIALGGVMAQALAGGLTVKLLAAKPVTIFHTVFGQLFFVLIAAMPVLLSASFQERKAMVADERRPSLHASAVIACSALWGQTLLGAAVRHGVAGVMPHIAGAVIATAAVMWAGLRILARHMDHDALRRSAMGTLSLVFSQVFLGLGAYMSRVATAGAPQPMPLMVWFTVAHAAAGVLALAASSIMTIEVFRHVRRPETAMAQRGVAVA